MNYIKYVVTFTLVVLLIGCSADNGTSPNEYSPQELTEQGWILFGTTDYQPALEKFQQALSKDDTFVEAYSGAGWANARLTNISNAIDYFTQCVNLSSSKTEAHAGLAFVRNAQKSYQAAINSANTALTQNANWNFSHDATLNYKDLHLLLAECYFAQLDFNSSLTQIQILNSQFSTNVSTYEGRAALAAEIERLRGIV